MSDASTDAAGADAPNSSAAPRTRSTPTRFTHRVSRPIRRAVQSAEVVAERHHQPTRSQPSSLFQPSGTKRYGRQGWR